jgi:HEPN domain-containing protein
MRNKVDHARGWFRKGESDLATVRSILAAYGPYDTACFHAQQAIEKYLKGVLAFAEQPIPRTHNLEELAQFCSGALPGSIPPDVDLAEITPYAVDLRYDFEFWPDRETAEKALAIAERLREVILAGVPKEAQP